MTKQKGEKTERRGNDSFEIELRKQQNLFHPELHIKINETI